MNYLKNKLSYDETMVIGQELERLFALQDKVLPEAKKGLLITELDNEGFPPQAIIKGIRALVDQDIKALKYTTIKESIKSFISYEEIITDCVYCGGRGLVTMICDKKNYAFACKCEARKNYGENFTVWNGELTQQINGKTYEYYEFKLLGNEYYSWLKMKGEKEEPEIDMSVELSEQEKHLIEQFNGKVVPC